MQQKHRHKLDALDISNVPDPPTALLYTRYAPALFAYLRQHTTFREDAEDVLVEVFLAALENEKFATMGEKEQQAWLWRVARNKAVDHFRRAVRRQSVTLDNVADSLYDDDEQAPEQVTLRSEEYTHLQTHLHSLTTLQQEVLRLRFTNDLRCAEIAAHLGKREGTIRVLLSRALNLLRGIYQQQKGENERYD